MIRHLLPRVHWSTYERDGQRRLVIWKQWGRHVWQCTEVRVG